MVWGIAILVLLVIFSPAIISMFGRRSFAIADFVLCCAVIFFAFMLAAEWHHSVLYAVSMLVSWGAAWIVAALSFTTLSAATWQRYRAGIAIRRLYKERYQLRGKNKAMFSS